MKKQNSKFTGGFSLVEIMVVVAILSIMAGAVSIGFHSFFETVRVQNAVSHIGDILSELDRKAITSENLKSAVFFEEGFLLADSETAGAGLLLSWEKESPECGAGEIKLISGDVAQLFVRNAQGEVLDAPMALAENGTVCVKPLAHDEREFYFELRSAGDFSNLIRFFRLNHNPGDAGKVRIQPNEYRLEILSPYSQKKLFENGTLLGEADSATLTIEAVDGEEKAEFELPRN